MELTRMIRLVEHICTHERVRKLYEQGDSLSSHQTKHDEAHASQVRDEAVKLANWLRSTNPNCMDDVTQFVVLPLGAYLHDIGRAIDVDKHDKAGAEWAGAFLREVSLPGSNEHLPEDVVKRVQRVIACHRTSMYTRGTVNDIALDITVIADKCVGDEDRVRPFRAAIYRALTPLRLTWIPLRRNGVHDRVNFAIKSYQLDPVGDELLLNLTIDTRVCRPELIYGLYSDRFQCCVLGAGKVGLKFRLVFNGQRYAYNKDRDTWLPV